MQATQATVGILSIGEMGLGIAKLLRAHGFRVVTNITGRSEATHARARSASLDLLPTDRELVQQSAFILSIVPPRDALATAQRIASASQEVQAQRNAHDGLVADASLYYIDLNAISPHSATEIADLFATSAPHVCLLDGGIFGLPPKQSTDNDDGNDGTAWTRPSLVVSGPHSLTPSSTAPAPAPAPGAAQLASVLNMRHIAATIGPASGLKMCFASMTKGFTGLAICAYTTAHRLGILEELRARVREFSPGTAGLAERLLVSMPPKAYRWVREMEEVADTFGGEDGGLDEGRELFEAMAAVYRCVAEETVLGDEKSGERVRGLDAADVAAAVSEGVERRKVKTE